MRDTRSKRLTTDVVANEMVMSRPMPVGRKRGAGTVAGKKAFKAFDDSDSDDDKGPKKVAPVKATITAPIEEIKEEEERETSIKIPEKPVEPVITGNLK